VLFKGEIPHLCEKIFNFSTRCGIPLLALFGPDIIVCPLKNLVKDILVDNW